MLAQILGLPRFTFLHIKNTELMSIIKEPERFTDEEAKASFDSFFNEVCSWREDFNTTALADFWAIGFDYDGQKPGVNARFLGLYEELMAYARDPDTYKEEETDGELPHF